MHSIKELAQLAARSCREKQAATLDADLAILNCKEKQADLLNAVKLPFQFVKNTFRPGVATLRQELRNTRRLSPGAVAEGADTVAQAAQNLFKKQNVRGFYHSGQNVAAVNPRVKNPALANRVMRHELRHATQFNAVNPNSLQGVIKKLNSAAPGSWQRSLGLYLGEVQANAAMHRNVGSQLWNAAKFMGDPRKALSYSKNPGYGGWRYGAIHAAPAVVAGGVATTSGVPYAAKLVSDSSAQTQRANWQASLAKDLPTVKKASLKPDVQLQEHQERIKKRLQEDNRLLIYHGLASQKEKLNEQFRKVLQEEGSSTKEANDMSNTLQKLVFNCIALSLLFKQCHWNAKGAMFKPLHDFLDEVYSTLVTISDDIAERLAALDTPVSGLAEELAANAAMPKLPVSFLSTSSIVAKLVPQLSSLCGMFKKAIQETEHDPVTSNMLQDMTHKLEKHLWMLRSQQEQADTAEKAAAAAALLNLSRKLFRSN